MHVTRYGACTVALGDAVAQNSRTDRPRIFKLGKEVKHVSDVTRSV